MRRLLWVLALLGGCKDDSTAHSAPGRAEPSRTLVGIYPEQWRCDRVASLDTLGALLGGTARQLDSAMQVPKGVPQPCNYELLTPEPEYWTFDVDCRDGMKQRADALFAQYRAASSEAAARYGSGEASPGKHSDAGVAAHPPEPTVDVAVGAKGLDHHGQGLLFIDDDAPCYVRVVGKDAPRRLLLARLVAKNLTLETAPMTPRARR